jgi:hypothetical protein
MEISSEQIEFQPGKYWTWIIACGVLELLQFGQGFAILTWVNHFHTVHFGAK